MIWPPWRDSTSSFPQIRRWGEGSMRSYYKPKQMKNLYDVETSVKKDVVSPNSSFVAHTFRVSIWDTRRHDYIPGHIPIWGSQENYWEGLDRTCMYSGLSNHSPSEAHSSHIFISLACTWARPRWCWSLPWRDGRTASSTQELVISWGIYKLSVKVSVLSLAAISQLELVIVPLHLFTEFPPLPISGLGVFWLIFLPVLGIYYFNRTRHTVWHFSNDQYKKNNLKSYWYKLIIVMDHSDDWFLPRCEN